MKTVPIMDGYRETLNIWKIAFYTATKNYNMPRGVS